MACACWNTDQIALLAKEHQHLSLEVKAEQALPFNEKTHLVLGVGVFRQKFAAQRRPLRMVGLHPNRIHADVPLRCLDPADLIGIGTQNCSLISTSLEDPTGRPLLKANATRLQFPSNGIWVAVNAPGLRRHVQFCLALV